MKYLIAILILVAGLVLIDSAGITLDLLRQHQPRYAPRTLTLGPVSYTETVCVENCGPVGR